MRLPFSFSLHALSVLQKLVLLSLVALAPAVAFCLVLQSVAHKSIERTAAEIDGTIYLDSIWPIVSENAMVTARSPSPKTAELLRNLRAANAAYAIRFQVEDEAEALVAVLEDHSLAPALRNREIRQRANDLKRAVGDASFLFAEPELVSHYAVHLIIFQLPDLLTTGELLHDLASDQSSLSSPAAYLALGQIKAAALAVDTTLLRFHRDVGSEFQSERLRLAGEKLQATLGALEFADPTQEYALDGTVLHIETMRAHLTEVSNALWVSTNGELRRLLETRLQNARRQLHLAMLLTALSLIASGACVIVLARSIVRPQSRLAQTMRAMANGDTRFAVPYRQAPGELGEVARAVEVFRCALIERQMLELDLALERDDLERRIEMRTSDLAASMDRVRRSQNIVQQALRAAGAGVVSHNHRTGEIWCSPEYMQIMGCPFEPETYLSMLHPDDRHLVAQKVEVAISRRNGDDLEFRYIRPDGVTIWINARWVWADQDELVAVPVAVKVVVRFRAISFSD
ncbi:MAG: PAS domain-containing protein, partial [Caulobacterales bacterium]